MDKNLTSRQKQAIETKRRLYRSAVELFKQYPYDEVKITDICEKANVSVGVFYHYFESKRDILHEAYLNFDNELEEALEIVKTTSPIDNIISIVEMYLDKTANIGPKYRNLFLRNELEMGYDDITSRKRESYQEVLENVKAAVDQGLLIGDENEITDDILRCLKGIVYHWSLYEGSIDLVEEGLRIAKILIDYYSKK